MARIGFQSSYKKHITAKLISRLNIECLASATLLTQK